MDGLLTVFLLLATATAAWLLLWPALPSIRERVAAWRVYSELKHALPASHYSVFRDVVPRGEQTGGESATRIDFVVTSPYGVFVIDTCNLSGSIFGAEGDTDWTCVRFRAKRKFQNPLRESHVHERALQTLYGLESGCFHSLVVFTGSAEFKTPMPARVTHLGGLIPFILVRSRESLGFERAERLAMLLESTRAPTGAETTAAHLAVLRETHGSRFGARQAVLGLGLIAALLILAGSLVHRFAEMPGRYPSPAATERASPFVANAPPPHIELPAVAEGTTSRAGVAAPEARPVGADLPALGAVANGKVRQAVSNRAAIDDRLAWESTLKCAYSEESRRCACYEPQGRKAVMDYESCRALADQGVGTPRK